MHGTRKTMNELHNILKLRKQLLPKKDATLAILAVRGGWIQKNNKKNKKPQQPAKGHWKRNCPMYLSGLMKKKKQASGASTLDIFTIKLYSFSNKSWVYDIGYGTHIYNISQGLRESKKLKLGSLNMHVDN
nr:hypothetical protein [Tanacetum cinerariifolium]